MIRSLSLVFLQTYLFFTCTDGFTNSPHTSLVNLWAEPSTALKALKKTSGGGRAPGSADNVLSSEEWQPAPCKPGEARLTVVQITDTYTLENLPSVKTLLADIRKKSEGSKVISMMTGDFLAPYLLSSVDRGQGMMDALAAIPIDFLTWGNHEADIPHKTVCRHVRSFPGTWLNSNMLDHEAMDHQKEFEIVELASPDGTNTRKVGLVAVLSDDPKLYSHFKAPGAFGGATIGCPWETLERLKGKLEAEYDVDTIIPLQHLYVPDDHKTCKMFDFPVILSGHDHHRVDEVVDGTRLLKPGMDSVYATVLDLIWPDAEAEQKPTIRSRFVKTADWEPDPELAEKCDRAYDCLAPLRNSELAKVPPVFEPLSSVDSRARVCTMGMYVCTLLRSSLQLSRMLGGRRVDCVCLMGGNIRGGTDYPEGSFFSLEALEAEIKSDEVIGVVPMPGKVLADGIAATHAGDPIPGWMQYDNGIVEDFTQNPPVVTQVRGRPIDPEKIYNVATKISDLTNGQSPPWTKHFKEHPELLPPKGAYSNIHAELMSYFAGNLWRRLWDSLSRDLDDACDAEPADADPIPVDDGPECDEDGSLCNAALRFETLDQDNDGKVSVEDIQVALGDLLGLSVDERELSLANVIHQFADITGTGEVTVEDIELFCEGLGEVYERDIWRIAFDKPTPATKLPHNRTRQPSRLR